MSLLRESVKAYGGRRGESKKIVVTRKEDLRLILPSRCNEPGSRSDGRTDKPDDHDLEEGHLRSTSEAAAGQSGHWNLTYDCRAS